MISCRISNQPAIPKCMRGWGGSDMMSLQVIHIIRNWLAHRPVTGHSKAPWILYAISNRNGSPPARKRLKREVDENATYFYRILMKDFSQRYPEVSPKKRYTITRSKLRILKEYNFVTYHLPWHLPKILPLLSGADDFLPPQLRLKLSGRSANCPKYPLIMLGIDYCQRLSN